MSIPPQFPALVARDGKIAVEQTDSSLLFAADDAVTVRVTHSCINYKDALAVTHRGKILRASPLIPGIDYAGEIVQGNAEFTPGDQVLLTGNAVGEKYSGGFAAYARAKPEWLLPLPADMTAQQAMTCGTAGLTAALCAMALIESDRLPQDGDIVISGASGGVGSFATALLAAHGYRVTAVSRPAAADYLRALGAADILSRQDMSAPPKPLEKSRWHGAVDCVGGAMLARILAETHYGGIVAACGLAGGHDLPATVMPFILRGVRLDGIDSVTIPRPLRQRAWQFLAQHLTTAHYAQIAGDTIGLAQIPAACEKLLAGEDNGRLLVNPAA